ncbi:MAG: hypothetical protein AB7T07_09200 [Steroidobacteraceae bacterium]
MTPADKRVLDMLDRWLASIELHLKYLDLDDANYRQIQPWPEHERPARWILEMAQQKILQLKTLCKSHIASNDESFAESLELMHFLANLVGIQNIKRYIPLADSAREKASPALTSNDVTQEAPVQKSRNAENDATREMQQVKVAPAHTGGDVERTREMPRLKTPAKKASPRQVTDPSPKRQPAAPKPLATPTNVSTQSGDARIQEIVIADAVRLLKWGREWHELTELIARMAERPAAAEIRRILRAHKNNIERQLRG